MYIVALGGNAILTSDEKGTFEEQAKAVGETVKNLRSLFERWAEVVITHGNGPQVGYLLLQQEKIKSGEMPLYLLDAMTQAQIGYLIQASLRNHLYLESNIVITRIVVDEKDKAFLNPTKPIGPFYKTKVFPDMIKQPEGFRRVVASPMPLEIVEMDTIKELAAKSVVIACGGGGIPVIKKGRKLQGVDAVIDKDFASQLLANQLGARDLVFLTAVEGVYLDYKKKDQRLLSKITIEEAKKYLSEGHFWEGSMKPKIEAAIRFLENGGKRVIVTQAHRLEQALEKKAGTIIL